MPLEEFYTGLFETALRNDELVVEVQVPPARLLTATAYKKFNLIESDQAIVGVAATVTTDRNRTCRDARIVLSNAGVIPIRAKSGEKALIGKSSVIRFWTKQPRPLPMRPILFPISMLLKSTDVI